MCEFRVCGFSKNSIFQPQYEICLGVERLKAEKVWICCRKELEEITKTVRNFNLHSKHNPKVSRKTLKRSLLLHLKPKRSPSRVSGRDECEELASLALFVLLLFCCVGGDERKLGSDFAERNEIPIDTCPGHISGSSQTAHAFEGNKDLNNFTSTNNLSGDATSRTPEVEELPLPPGRTTPPPPPPAAPPGPKAPPLPPPSIRSSGGPPKPGNMKRTPGPPRGPSTSVDENDRSVSPKTKLKPLFWDKMNTSPNQSMVWNEVKAGSFQLDEEMMESLFGYVSGQSKGNNGKASSNINSQPKFIQIIDPRKAQNLAISLKALTVTTENVCNALKEGTNLPVQLISTLIKMPPTQEEEVKLRLYNADPGLLGPADHLLKVMIEIPFVACTKLKNSRLFLKLLEAVLKTGNRMNVGTYRGGAQAIKLDTLLKLSDVKGTDGKTTLLTFVVQEIIRSEGTKAARTRTRNMNITNNDLEQMTEKCYWKLGLDVVSQLSIELQDVKKAAVIDGDHITSTVLKLGSMFRKTKDLINNELNSNEEAREFCDAFNGFMENAETEFTWMHEEESRIMALVKSTGDFFHGNSAKDEGIRLFIIVRDFLKLLDKVCSDIKKTTEMSSKKNDTSIGKKEFVSQQNRQQAWFNIRDKLFPALKDRKIDYSSSDDDDDLSP
ncbi:hypothetical protein R6Q57_016044 [Mikania cordata]